MRIQSAAKNSSVGLIYKIISMLLNFAVRTVLIHYLGQVFVGFNGLFSSILRFLSLAEMGVGTAIIYSMYKPLKEGDKETIAAYIYYFKKVYNVIGLLILVLGLALIPLLPFLINNYASYDNIILYYVLTLLCTVASYLFSYRRNIFIAEQKEYIANFMLLGVMTAIYLSQIFVVVFTRNYALYLIVDMVLIVLGDRIINIVVDKKHPYLKEFKNAKLDTDIKKNLYKNVKALMLHKIGSTLILSVDNILLSAYISIEITGTYSNYVMITSAAIGILQGMFNAIVPSIGNMKLSCGDETCESRFRELALLNHWLYGFAAVGLFCCINQFVSLSWGDMYTFTLPITIVVIAKFYVLGTNDVAVSFVSGGGLFTKNKYKSLVEAGLNTVLSIIFVQFWGVFGILFATVISLLLCTGWFDPYIIYKHWFHKKPFKYYFQNFSRALLVSAICVGLYYLFDYMFIANSWGTFLAKFGLVTVCFNIVYALFHFKSKEFKALKGYVRMVLSLITNKVFKKKSSEE